MTDKERYTLGDDGFIRHNGEVIDDKTVVERLNCHLKRLDKQDEELYNMDCKITECRRREQKFQRIVSGLMAFIELKMNKDLWWDWND